MQVGHLSFFLLDPKSLVYFLLFFLGLEENFSYSISIAPSTLGEGFSYLELNPLKRAFILILFSILSMNYVYIRLGDAFAKLTL